jgi:hypothetical protein
MHPAVKNERENETDMTIYPLEFHRRCERKWERRAGLLRVFESSPQPDGSVPSYCIQGMERARVDKFALKRSPPNHLLRTK